MIRAGITARVTSKNGGHPLVVGTRVLVAVVFTDGVARCIVRNHAIVHLPVSSLTPVS